MKSKRVFSTLTNPGGHMHSIPERIRRVELTICAVLYCIFSTGTAKVESSVIVEAFTATEVIEWFHNDGGSS